MTECSGPLRRAEFTSQRVSVLIGAFLLLLGSAASIAPADAQQEQPGKVYRIGYLREGQPAKSLFEAFQQGLRERGYVEGRNVVIEALCDRELPC